MLKRISCKDIYTMKRSSSYFITIALLVMLVFGAAAQKQKSPQKGQSPVKSVKPTVPFKSVKTNSPVRPGVMDDPAAVEKKIKDMVTYLGFVLNTLGSSNTSARDKDVLITESYSKIFRDAKVQVEDDLDEERGV